MWIEGGRGVARGVSCGWERLLSTSKDPSNQDDRRAEEIRAVRMSVNVGDMQQRVLRTPHMSPIAAAVADGEEVSGPWSRDIRRGPGVRVGGVVGRRFRRLTCPNQSINATPNALSPPRSPPGAVAVRLAVRAAVLRGGGARSAAIS